MFTHAEALFSTISLVTLAVVAVIRLVLQRP